MIGSGHYQGNPGVIKGLVINEGLIVAASGYLVENQDIASGTIALTKLQHVTPGCLLVADQTGTLREVTLGSGLYLQSGVLCVSPAKPQVVYVKERRGDYAHHR